MLPRFAAHSAANPISTKAQGYFLEATPPLKHPLGPPLAYDLLQKAIGSVMRFDELLLLPGAAPLVDLFEDPRALQLQEVRNAQVALEIVIGLCAQ